MALLLTRFSYPLSLRGSSINLKNSHQQAKCVAFKVKTATPVTRTALKKDLEAIRKNSVSCTIDLYSKGLSAVSAPVFNATGKCVASLTIAGPTERFRSELKLLTAIVKDVAAKASGMVAA